MSLTKEVAEKLPEKLRLVLVWHMHQPDYRDPATGEYRLPWVYLHAIKDYADMAWHLEQHEAARCVVNFVPILLEQLEDYAEQCRSRRIRDRLLGFLLRDEHAALSPEEREYILDRCFHANHNQMIRPFPRYEQLHELATAVETYGNDATAYLSDRYLFDLITWYHLSWTGESLRREHALIGTLMKQGGQFTAEQRCALFDCLAQTIIGIIPRYRALEAAGRIELSTTPYYHPLAPLLIDFSSAHDAQPSLPLPRARQYPGGEARVRVHAEAAADSHERWFGRRPTGMWPAEGAVSSDVVRVMGQSGAQWVATGEGVLANSLRAAGTELGPREQWLYQPYRLADDAVQPWCFFRDDRLSDLIGFEYRLWDGGHAASHFTAELEKIMARAGDDVPLVSVILDGENAWEHYPYNGHYFLTALYEALGQHADIRMLTYRQWLQDYASTAKAGSLSRLSAGSWVYGDFTTWIGSNDKNAAWDLLVAAKQTFDDTMAGTTLSPEERTAAARQMGVCESSDWFWWFGDYNPAVSVASFDALYRLNLQRLYELLRRPVPQELHQPLSVGSATETADGAMRRSR